MKVRHSTVHRSKIGECVKADRKRTAPRKVGPPDKKIWKTSEKYHFFKSAETPGSPTHG